MKERKPDGGLAEWIETLEAMGGEDDGEMLCLLLELRRFREDKPELIEQLEALKAKTSMTMRVGMGNGNLFVHGDYESIKTVQGIVFRMEAAEAQVKKLTAGLDKESEIRHRIHEELNAIKGEQLELGSHEWDSVGERCLKCGDKDWMADPVCSGSAVVLGAKPMPVIELPPPEPDSGSDSQVDILAGFANRMRDKCIASIRAAGLEVKP